ncbi:NADH-dependent flavin oxidoreductase [Dickeya fangzhongdai]|uniref:NADH-dependent flavin oxidoreductase n=1 Tax=Dickeya fangzhongdai TaxID=1778540 RepID=A0A2K8QP89_9GAMM|nr:NADH-dependent flavin oxidoreductase [Dickeya fangzhongdai]ATZ94895.1 NADH-dependent flavin oxidoreductase [Dickeya fangzhongdai]QOH48337.1 NADH-dependent flavin oxidoreductase [Dickeya fangzhongdai]QOH52639.1 NADH-dependent flavin oxidoreductase [Dickeya fangzhongdai]WOY00158.1 NADH-dependent flavin oxidoreductase [Dickeya fangzhongdai]WOY04693.1 NADH-dependent flavin oxidoreductase [Dickeya fangzhongdai]
MKDYRFLKPITLPNGVVIKNRVVLPPMTEQMSFEDGTVTLEEINYMQQRAGGVGLFITPVAYINKEGKGFEGQLGADDDSKIPGLAKLAHAIKSRGAKAILQIFSAGRMTNSLITRGLQPVSASAVAAPRNGAETPRELSSAEVVSLISDFAQATRRAIQAGFDGIELHGANTYLLQQFVSPHSNRRTDEWGGSLDKRLNLPLTVIDEVMKIKNKYASPSFIVGYRLSPEEIEEPGITLDDTKYFVGKLQQTELDYIHVSMGSVWRSSIRDKDNTAPIITQIKQESHKKPVIAVGNVRTPEQAEEVMQSGIDFVALGHQLIIEPNWVEKVVSGHEDTIRYHLHAADLDDLGIKPPFLEFIRDMPGFDILGLKNDSARQIDNVTYL